MENILFVVAVLALASILFNELDLPSHLNLVAKLCCRQDMQPVHV